jgi:DNA polymerase-3 subunit alpha/error-prone DNA polymerase
MQLEGLNLKQRIASLQSTMNGKYQSLEDFINRIPIGRGDQILIHWCLPLYNQDKKSIARNRQIDSGEFKPETEFMFSGTVKEYTLPY